MDTLVTYTPRSAKRRVGRLKDGGYVIVSGLCYDALISCGINNEVSFEGDLCALYPGMPGFAFDGTVDCPAEMPPQIKFYKHNIGPANNAATTNLKPFLEHYQNVFMKMDIEGHEWAWLLCLEPQHMRAMKQIVMEVHDLWDADSLASADQKEAALRKLAQTHYLVHVHGNNYAKCRRGMPCVLELTYVRKDVGVLSLNETPFPIPGLDFPNNPKKKDYSFTTWPFVTVLSEQ